MAFNIFLCFFLRMRLRRFLISDPMSVGTLADLGIRRHVPPPGRCSVGVATQSSSPGVRGAATTGRLNRKRAPPPWAW